VAFNLVELFEAPRDQGLREFQALLLLLSPSRFQKGKDGKTPLDRYYERARETGIRARDALRKGVVEALEVLGNAFLTEDLRQRLQDPERLGAYHREILLLVYRLLFLLYAESRGLLPHGGELSWVYEREYSVTALRERAARQDPLGGHAGAAGAYLERILKTDTPTSGKGSSSPSGWSTGGTSAWACPP
jgi:hypothetical protein